MAPGAKRARSTSRAVVACILLLLHLASPFAPAATISCRWGVAAGIWEQGKQPTDFSLPIVGMVLIGVDGIDIRSLRSEDIAPIILGKPGSMAELHFLVNGG